MAAWIKNLSQLMFVGLLLSCLIVVARGKGGGGGRGGGGGGRGGSGGRGGGRGSRGGSGRTGSSGKSGFSRTATRAGILAGTYYGSRYYMTTRRYSSGDYEPSICENTRYSNGTEYGLFICPMELQPDHYTYCCGDEGKETCCGYWDDGGRVAGAVIGIIFAIIAIVVVILLCCCCCCKSCCKKSERKPPSSGDVTNWDSQHRTEMTPYPPAKPSNDDSYLTNERTHNGDAVPYNATAPPYMTYTSNEMGLPYPIKSAMPLAPPSYDTATDHGRYPTVQ